MVDTKIKVAVDYKKCNPKHCEKGVCAVIGVCPSKIWKQLEPYDFPFPIQGFCQECGKCVDNCPFKAIKML